MKRAPLLTLVCAVCLLTACFGPKIDYQLPNAPEGAIVVPPLPPEPTPTPTSEERAEQFTQAFRVALRRMFVAEPYTASTEMVQVVAQKNTWRAMQHTLERSVRAAYEEACAVCGERRGGFTFLAPNWKMIAALFHRLGDNAAPLLITNCAVTAEISQENMAVLSVDMTDFLATIDGLESTSAFGAKLTYNYLNTIYDADGMETEYVAYVFEDGYLETLRDPLPGCHIKNGWYNSRDAGTRKHTGTDIRADADTPILSCTDGVVAHIGSNSGAGNYVVVRDPYGFEYHYYHMIRLTDFLHEGDAVNAGDVIGNVGDTGNSDANHLHLTISSPQFTYINPYPMLYAVRTGAALPKK